MSAPLTLTIVDTDAMEALGERIGAGLRAGDLVALEGELGAGKTTLTRGIGRALGARGAITSPTFVLARTHPTASGVPLVHVDAYRLGSVAELDDLDLDLESSVTVVEWAAGRLDPELDRVEVAIERPTGGDPLADEEPRTVVITAVGPQGLDLLARLSGILGA